MLARSEQSTMLELRKRVNLTRRQVAIAIGVTEKTIYIWETTPIEPKMTVLQVKLLMDLLQCSLEELIEATRKEESQR